MRPVGIERVAAAKLAPAEEFVVSLSEQSEEQFLGAVRQQAAGLGGFRLPQVAPAGKCRLRQMRLERIKDWLLLEDEYVSNMERLKPLQESQEEDRSKVDDLRGSPMGVGTLEEIIDDNHAVVSSSVGPEYYVSILSFVDKSQLEPGCSILMHNKVLSVVGLLNDDTDPMVSVMKVEKAPLESYADVGGLETQIQEIKEAVELPLSHPELYEDIGIKPPKGVILYGEPGTGKTLLAKAVANATSATFLRVVGSELIQKYLGDGPKLVRELFRVANENSPAIVFIDEIDAVGTKRYDSQSGGEREIQRTMLELLNQMDGFDAMSEVKVIMATNRIESLDPALLRPGRIDRKIEFPAPDQKTRRHIFQIHTSKMNLADDVNLEEFIMSKDELSGADIKAMCTEAGLLALRERRMKVSHAEFKKADMDARNGSLSGTRRTNLEPSKPDTRSRRMIADLKPYPAMKDSGIEWLGEVPEHWEVKRGKNVFSCIDVRSETGEEELLSAIVREAPALVAALGQLEHAAKLVVVHDHRAGLLRRRHRLDVVRRRPRELWLLRAQPAALPVAKPLVGHDDHAAAAVRRASLRVAAARHLPPRGEPVRVSREVRLHVVVVVE